MKKEGTIGVATFLALAAVVGFSLQSGPKSVGAGQTEQSAAVRKTKPALEKDGGGPGCSNLTEALEDFLDIKNLVPPGPCYPSGKSPGEQPPGLMDRTSQLKFVIAILPDPVHTHLSTTFDQFAVAIQEGAQDEKYDFDDSWFPWDQVETPYVLREDEKASNREKDLKESQPGIILFRRSLDCDKEKKGACKETGLAPTKKGEAALSQSYRRGLVVFVVGEDATHGIHRDQFRNALAWINNLRSGPEADTKAKRLAILGPTFSGSLASISRILLEPGIAKQLDLDQGGNKQRLAIYSGSVSSKPAADAFQNTFASQVTFHSFVQDDDEILRQFCRYMVREQSGFDSRRMAIISEDETAYGSSGMGGDADVDKSDKPAKDDNKGCPGNALKLYYPRDISALRGAYQTQSLFDVGTSQQQTDTQRRSLPTDLADPTGKVHDSIRSYGGNQTPLAQEAFLLEIVAALRELHARYILLRSSNTLDQLFLTNFLRRSYTDGRIVIFGSDLMFIRERGATGLGGSMTLSTYPPFPLGRDWTEHQSLPAADRVFSSDTSEGTYVALRLLLSDTRLSDGSPDQPQCQVMEEKDKSRQNAVVFLPSVSCAALSQPIPDYSPPFWTLSDQCGESMIANVGEQCPYPGPPTWLSVIGVNRFWPMASLTGSKAHPRDLLSGERSKQREKDPGGRPEMPLGMKVFLLILLGFSVFHAWCCRSGSFTAKPAFRAHFASIGDQRHTLLIFSGSCCVAFLAIVTGWGCGVFHLPAPGLSYPWFALACVIIVCLAAWGAILANSYTTRRLSQDLPPRAQGMRRMTGEEFTSWNYWATTLFISAIILFCLAFIRPIECVLLPDNRVLTYWRSMHLVSGVSPLVPIFAIFAGLYLSFWYALHGLALFGPDRPCLPPRERLTVKLVPGKQKDFLRMFSQENAAAQIDEHALPVNRTFALVGSVLFGLFLAIAFGIAKGIPVRSLGAQNYAIIFLLLLDLCCTLSIVQAWRLYQIWGELRRLLTYLDRLPLRRTLAALRGFSWGSVWKMSGNVLDVRYKVISGQLECMNHTIASLQEFLKRSSDRGARNSLAALLRMRRTGMKFADWYSINYDKTCAGDLTKFQEFQQSIAFASGTLFTQLLLPAWRQEEASLLLASSDQKEEPTIHLPPQAKDEHIRNAEEFVCLNYMGFVQNILGRLRTMAVTIVMLFLASTVAMSTYPFDPRQALSAVLIALFVIVGAVVVKVYADMHRDSTLSHVTNTKPGELGPEFWFKVVGFGFAPLVGLLARVFPGITDFVFSWLQPGISSLK